MCLLSVVRLGRRWHQPLLAVAESSPMVIRPIPAASPPLTPFIPPAPYGQQGGTQQANALAEEQSWAAMINFLNDPWERVR